MGDVGFARMVFPASRSHRRTPAPQNLRTPELFSQVARGAHLRMGVGCFGERGESPIWKSALHTGTDSLTLWLANSCVGCIDLKAHGSCGSHG